MNAPRDKSYADSLRAALTDPAEADAYLAEVEALGDPAALLLAQAQVAEAQGRAEP